MNTKLLYTLSFLLTGLLFLSSCDDKSAQQNAKEYRDTIFNSADTVVNYVYAFEGAVESKDVEQVKSAHETLLGEIDKSKDAIEDAGAYNEDATFQESALEFMNYYDSYATQDYAEILVLMETDSMTVDKMDNIYDILDAFYDGEGNHFDKFNSMDDEFALTYEIYAADME